MKKNELLEMIESKREELIEVLENAFCESIDHRQLKINVELYDDGDIKIWEDIAGGNSFTSSSFEGTSVCVASFCNQYLEAENGEYENEEDWFEWYKEEYKSQEAEQKLEIFIDRF